MTAQATKQRRKTERKSAREEEKEKKKEKSAAASTAPVVSRRRSSTSPFRFAAALSRGLIVGALIGLVVMWMQQSGLFVDASANVPQQPKAAANATAAAAAAAGQAEAKEGTILKEDGPAGKAAPKAAAAKAAKAAAKTAKAAKAEASKPTKLAKATKPKAASGEAPGNKKRPNWWAKVVKKVQQGVQKVRRPRAKKAQQQLKQ